MKNFAQAHSVDQSRNEEIANSISHGLAFIGSIVGTPFLIIRASEHGTPQALIGVIVFAVSMMALYLSSTLYHALPWGTPKRVFKVMDHASIYLLIAGTYTPFTLGVLKGALGWTLFGIVWGLALIGVCLKALNRMKHPIVSTALYLLMGWLIIFAIKPLSQAMSFSGLMWIVAGGLSYTLGVIFYLTDHKLKYGHCIWHLFVMAGTACHYFAVLWHSVKS